MLYLVSGDTRTGKPECVYVKDLIFNYTDEVWIQQPALPVATGLCLYIEQNKLCYHNCYSNYCLCNFDTKIHVILTQFCVIVIIVYVILTQKFMLF